jgi:hypothetical protein
MNNKEKYNRLSKYIKILMNISLVILLIFIICSYYNMRNNNFIFSLLLSCIMVFPLYDYYFF